MHHERFADGHRGQRPHVQDRLGRRFIYLSWGTVDESGTFTMFRRAKLLLDVIPADVLAAAARDGLLVGRLGLTDAQGGPLCARVEPPHITWTAERAGWERLHAAPGPSECRSRDVALSRLSDAAHEGRRDTVPSANKPTEPGPRAAIGVVSSGPM